MGYAFPPQPLIRPFVNKAVANAALCVAVVPAAITAQYWHKLVRVRASTLDHRQAVDGFLRNRNPLRQLEYTAGKAPQGLAVFV